jgi:ferredoxin--NADP+ reductase
LEFFGNTQLGRQVSLAELQSSHHAVVLATGVDSDREHGISGADSARLYRASEIVGWYNSHPDHEEVVPDFGQGRVCILGHGNVAADIARLLLSSPERLRQTDISARALAYLADSPVREVHLIGRRGPAETRFSAPILAELLALPDVGVVLDERELGTAPSLAAREILEIFAKAAAVRPAARPGRRLYLHFRCVPHSVRADPEGLQITLSRQCSSSTVLARLTVDAAISAVGFHLSAAPHSSLGTSHGSLSNQSGRLLDPEERALPGLYTVGWAARGASGTIGTCRSDAERLARVLLADAPDLLQRDVTGRMDLMTLFAARGHRPVTFDQWLQLDRLEQTRGANFGKPRLKMSTVRQMLEAIGSQPSYRNDFSNLQPHEGHGT